MEKIKYISVVNRAFSIFLLLAISFSIISIVYATAPNPGHDFTSVSGGVIQGDLMYGSAADTLSALAKNTSATRYLSNTGTSNNPAWAQVVLTDGVSGTLPIGNGGTNITTYTTGDILYSSASNILSKLAGSAGFLKSTGAAAPTWSSIGLTSDVSGILPTANGGTGIAYFTASGPTTARVYTFPDAAATVLTSNSAVTVAQGGTGLTASVSDAVLVGDSTSAYTARSLPTGCAGTTTKLLYDSTTNLFSCGTDQGSTFNQSVAAQGAGFATDTYLTGSSIAIPASSLKIGSRYHLIFNVSKTGAGTATPIINVRFGTNGSTADTARLTFTFLAGTAVADIGTFEIFVTFRTVGSGSSAVMQGTAKVDHSLSTTGLQNLPGKVLMVTSGGFDSTVASSIIGVSVNGGASAAWTVQQVQAELTNLQ